MPCDDVECSEGQFTKALWLIPMATVIIIIIITIVIITIIITIIIITWHSTKRPGNLVPPGAQYRAYGVQWWKSTFVGLGSTWC
ncbi:MAG: hypothetical protein ACT6R6_18730 [Flavobacterium sp.]|uniref:hypothetical protein n=1 Tax=Flavobacterium sp. TaxID=239 RepID=UPI0040337F0B